MGIITTLTVLLVLLQAGDAIRDAPDHTQKTPCFEPEIRRGQPPEPLTCPPNTRTPVIEIEEIERD